MISDKTCQQIFKEYISIDQLLAKLKIPGQTISSTLKSGKKTQLNLMESKLLTEES